MVEPPRLQAVFDTREKIIPEVYMKHCKYDYKLEIIPPVKEKNPLPGPIPRSVFRILNSKGKLVAYFHPHENSECYDEDFKPKYDKMVKDIEKAAKQAEDDFRGL